MSVYPSTLDRLKPTFHCATSSKAAVKHDGTTGKAENFLGGEVNAKRVDKKIKNKREGGDGKRRREILVI